MISIIIPVYNVKLYLDNCIQSVIQQSYTDFECILVDDGSTDGSSEICDQWAEKDNRIIIPSTQWRSIIRSKQRIGTSKGRIYLFY